MRKQEQERGARKEGRKGTMRKKVEDRRTEGKDEEGERK